MLSTLLVIVIIGVVISLIFTPLFQPHSENIQETFSLLKEVDGKLKWSPPETGVYERNKALGEYVVFTDGPLILHGPVAKDAVKHHESFPHLCAGLTLYSARKLYSEVYIGTKIIYKSYMGSPTLPPGRKK